MKKRITAIALIAVMALMLAACGGKSKMNETNTQVAEDVVNTIDNYLDGRITASQAKETINEEKDKIIDVEYDEDKGDSSYMSIEISLLDTDLKDNGSTDNDSLIEHRNNIADLVGMDKRK